MPWVQGQRLASTWTCCVTAGSLPSLSGPHTSSWTGDDSGVHRGSDASLGLQPVPVRDFSGDRPALGFFLPGVLPQSFQPFPRPLCVWEQCPDVVTADEPAMSHSKPKRDNGCHHGASSASWGPRQPYVPLPRPGRRRSCLGHEARAGDTGTSVLATQLLADPSLLGGRTQRWLTWDWACPTQL
jgi:hypothetical protein